MSGAGEGEDSHSHPPLSAYRLPRGRHDVSSDQIAENQRWRLLGAAAEVLVERGYARTKASDIAASAGVSRGTFYEFFKDLPDCLLAAYGMAAECVCDLADSACSGEVGGRRACGWHWTRSCDSSPRSQPFAHLLGPEVAAGVPAIAAARERLIEQLARTGADRHSIDGAFALVSERIAAGQVARLPELGPQLAELIRPAAGGPGKPPRGAPAT